MGIIYKVTNTINGKIYIGKTVTSLHRRKMQHLYFKVAKTHFQHALLKYGKENFTWEKICTCKDSILNDVEKFFILIYKSSNSKLGYNMTLGGDGAACGKLNVSKRPDVREKLKYCFLGKKHTIETKLKLRNLYLGIKLSDERKLLISKGQTGIKRPAGENSKLSKKFLITFPDGHVELVKGLRKFCRDHKLYPKIMRLVANGKKDKHKNFKCRYYESGSCQ